MVDRKSLRDFLDFRELMARTVEPHVPVLAEAWANIGLEGGPGFMPLWRAWEEIETMVSLDEYAAAVVSDAVHDACSEMRNPWEHAPGCAPWISPEQETAAAYAVYVEFTP